MLYSQTNKTEITSPSPVTTFPSPGDPTSSGLSQTFTTETGPTQAVSNPSKKSNSGAVAGGVIGGLAGGAIIATAIVLWLRRRQARIQANVTRRWSSFAQHDQEPPLTPSAARLMDGGKLYVSCTL